MQLSQYQNLILEAVLAEIHRFADIRLRSYHQNRSGQLLRRKADMAFHNEVYYRPTQWVGRRLTTVESQRFSCAVAEMESVGLLEIVDRDASGRIAVIALTPVGVDKANELKTRANGYEMATET